MRDLPTGESHLSVYKALYGAKESSQNAILEAYISGLINPIEDDFRHAVKKCGSGTVSTYQLNNPLLCGLGTQCITRLNDLMRDGWPISSTRIDWEDVSGKHKHCSVYRLEGNLEDFQNPYEVKK